MFWCVRRDYLCQSFLKGSLQEAQAECIWCHDWLKAMYSILLIYSWQNVTSQTISESVEAMDVFRGVTGSNPTMNFLLLKNLNRRKIEPLNCRKIEPNLMQLPQVQRSLNIFYSYTPGWITYPEPQVLHLGECGSVCRISTTLDIYLGWTSLLANKTCMFILLCKDLF